MDTNPEIRERILSSGADTFRAIRTQRAADGRCGAEIIEDLDERCLGGDAGMAAIADRLGLGRRGVGAGAGESGQSAALSALWTEAQELANDSLNVAQAAWDAERAEAEKLRVELSSAFETQGAELEALKGKLTEVESEASAAAAAAEQERVESRRQVTALTDQAHTATARAQEIEKRAEDLKTALNSAQASAATVTAELEAERKQHAATRGRLDTSSTELVTVKARAEAQARVQIEQAERLKRVETELTQARACGGGGPGGGGEVAGTGRGARRPSMRS